MNSLNKFESKSSDTSSTALPNIKANSVTPNSVNSEAISNPPSTAPMVISLSTASSISPWTAPRTDTLSKASTTTSSSSPSTAPNANLLSMASSRINSLNEVDRKTSSIPSSAPLISSLTKVNSSSPTPTSRCPLSQGSSNAPLRMLLEPRPLDCLRSESSAARSLNPSSRCC